MSTKNSGPDFALSGYKGSVEEHGLGNVINIDRNELYEIAEKLKESGYNLFLFVAGVDYPDVIKLTYRVLAVNSTDAKSVFIKTQVPKDDPVIASMTHIWPNASWHERETYDLLGVEFKEHPDMRRIFMPDDWVGHPLRKDYSDDHMIVFPEFLKDKEKKAAKPPEQG